MKKRGLSLIVLIITVIVVIILAAVVILTLSKNNPIESAKESAFKEDIRNFQIELEEYVGKNILKDIYSDSQISLDITPNFDTMKEYISSFKKNYEGKLGIKNNNLVYFEDMVTEQEEKWLKDLKIESYLTSFTEANSECFIWSGNTIKGVNQDKLNAYLESNNGVLKLPANCKQIGRDAIQNNNITYLIINEGCTYIDFRGIMGCSKLKKVNFPSTLISCYDPHNAILFCSNFEGVEVSKNNPVFTSFDGFLYSKDGKILYKSPATIEECIIRDGTEEVWPFSFFDAKKMKKINIPNTVKKLGRYAFHYSPLEYDTFVISDNVEEMGDYVFGNSTIKKYVLGSGLRSFYKETFNHDVENIEISEDNPNFTCIDNIVYNKDITKILFSIEKLNIENYVIPSTVTDINGMAFFGLNSLKGEIFIPKTVVNIGSQAFDSYRLTSIKCEVESKPDTWSDNWVTGDRLNLVEWGCTN